MPAARLEAVDQGHADNVTRSYTQRYSGARWLGSQAVTARPAGLGSAPCPTQPVHAPYGPLPEGGTVRPITRWGTPSCTGPSSR